MDAEVVQRLPSVDAAIVSITERRADGIIADRTNVGDGDIFLAELQHFLAGSMAPDFGGGGVDAQVFAGQLKMRAVVEAEFKEGGLLVELDVGGDGGGHKCLT